jgi:hypothetical protein
MSLDFTTNNVLPKESFRDNFGNIVGDLMSFTLFPLESPSCSVIANISAKLEDGGW